MAAASGLEYTGENRSSLSTPVYQTQGGIGAQSFVFGGNPNLITAAQAMGKNPWPWAIGAAAVAALVLFMVLRK